MRRSAFVTAAVVCAAGTARAAEPSAPRTIAVLGDSLARGTGASRADGGFIFPAFRALLQRAPGSRLDSFAIGGSVAADVARLQVPRLSEAAYDIVVLCVGGNDVVRRTASAAFAATYREILVRTQRLAPHARIIACGIPDVSISPIFAGDTEIARLAAGDDRAAHAICREVHADFVDVYAVSRTQRANPGRFLSGDRFHPSDAGYRLLQRVFEPILLRG